MIFVLMRTKCNALLIAVIFCMFTLQAAADIKITTTDTRIEASGTRYYFLAEWTSNQGGVSVCDTSDLTLTRCSIAISLLKSPGLPYIIATGPSWSVPVSRNGKTMGELLKDLNNAGFQAPYQGSILVPNGVPVDRKVCISYMHTRTGPTIGGGFGPMGSCVVAQPRPPRCEVQGDLNIDHKMLSEDQLQGAMASTQLSLLCQQTSNIIVSIGRPDPLGVSLRSDGSLYSILTVNGKNAENGIVIPVSKNQTTPFTVSSMLNAIGRVTPGPFNGSTTITISLP